MDPSNEKITIRVPVRFLKQIDFLVRMDDFSSRSEAIRAAIRDMVGERVELVMDKLGKMEEANKTYAKMTAFETDVLKK